jgi:RimJ/RimL family protein N-acetyltransferase
MRWRVDILKNISIRELETDRLILKKPTMNEQFQLWNILRDENVNRYYFPTPDRIFDKNNLKKDNIHDLKKARQIFMEQLNDWNRQQPFYEKKIESINSEDNGQKFTWSIFLKNGEVIGQITVQSSNKYPNNPEIRNIGWFVSPKYQGNGYASEAAIEVLRFMFEEVEIEKIITSAAIANPGSWKIMEKLGFERIGEKASTYFDNEDNILSCYCYRGNKELFLSKYNSIVAKF